MTHEIALHEALAALRRAGDVDHAEVRFVDETRERIRVRNGALEGLESEQRRGIGVRVVARGAWGFAAMTGCTVAGAVATALRARDVAIASARVSSQRVKLAGIPPAKGRYETRLRVDPFTVPLDTKIDLLVRATDALREHAPAITRADATMLWTRQHKHLLTFDGIDVEQVITWGGAGMDCIATADDGRVQRRSYPAGEDGSVGQGGYERIDGLGLVEHAPRVRDEALALLQAEQLAAGTRTVILESSQLALQIHESCGHATELDRVYGSEISLAGGSFLDPSMLDTYRYGSPRVHLVADATCAGGLGTFGWDDEGVAASRTDLVRAGMLTGFLSSRETAARLGRESSGSMRADGATRTPLIRMVNVNLLADPRGPSLDELIADTDDGVLIATNRSWSIDDVRLNFQFGCEIAWEIKHGKRTRILRDPVYTGVTPRFWSACDAICRDDEWQLWGILNCGKGEPMQLMGVGHGAAPARFRDIEVGHG